MSTLSRLRFRCIFHTQTILVDTIVPDLHLSDLLPLFAVVVGRLLEVSQSGILLCSWLFGAILTALLCWHAYISRLSSSMDPWSSVLLHYCFRHSGVTYWRILQPYTMGYFPSITIILMDSCLRYALSFTYRVSNLIFVGALSQLHTGIYIKRYHYWYNSFTPSSEWGGY